MTIETRKEVEKKDEASGLPDLRGPGEVVLSGAARPAGLPDLGGPGEVVLSGAADSAGLPDFGGPGDVVLSGAADPDPIGTAVPATALWPSDSGGADVRIETRIARGAAGGTVDFSLAAKGVTGEELESLWRNHLEPIVRRLQQADGAAS